MTLHKWTVALVATTVFGGLINAARADTALQQFNDIYGDRVRKATASRDTRQQLALATQLMSDAEQLGPGETMKAELYLKAAEYALADQGGDELARKAVEKLQALSVPAAAEGNAALVPMLRQRYRNATNAQRYAVGRLLMGALEAEANAEVSGGQVNGAGPLYREAFALAQGIDPGAAQRIKLEQNNLDARRVTVTRIEGLEAKLRGSSADPHEEGVLARLLLLDMDEPVQASMYLSGNADPTLREMTSLARKEMKGLTEDELLKLAEWLRTQAQAEPDFAKLSAFGRAQACYDRFLELHHAEDLPRLRVSTAQEQNAIAISKLEGIKTGSVDSVASIVLVPMDQFSRRFGAAFPIDTDEARGGIATCSNQYEDWSPKRLFAGERNDKQWCLALDSGELEVHWPKPVIGQYMLFFGRGTGGADLWKRATIQINGGKPLPVQNVSASDDILVDLGSLTRITDLRVAIQGRLHPGLAAIEIHRDAFSPMR